MKFKNAVKKGWHRLLRGLSFRKSRKLRKSFRRSLAGLAFITSLALLYWSSSYLFGIIFATKSDSAALAAPAGEVTYYNSPVTVSVSQAAAAQAGAYFFSYFDSFSNDLQIDTAQTGLRYDNKAAALTFPLAYSVKETSAPKADFSAAYGAFSENNAAKASDKRCLDGHCLSLSGTALAYDGRALSLPASLSGKDLVSVSIGLAGDSWLAGFVYKEGDKSYKGEAYRFDGKSFSLILGSDKFSSQYYGQFGFGGTAADFLVIYGAYGSIAYEVEGGEAKDVSPLFSYRVSILGFHPEAVRAQAGGITSWYVYSLSPDRPQFLKLWSDASGALTGEVVYDVFSGSFPDAVSLVSVGNDQIVLAARVGGAWKEIDDQGFDNTQAGVFYSREKDLDQPSTLERLEIANLCSSSALCPGGRLYFSSDGQAWKEVSLGNSASMDLPSGAVSKFFLKAEFPASSSRFFSPFLDQILFDFYYQK